jgi:catechol 2,3-dioxygenase-like lactoylglutathione lyase family enzyme
MHFQIQVVTLSVLNVDRAVAFYRDQLGWPIDVDYAPTADFRVVQMTPPGSGCSIQFGVGVTSAPVGSSRMLYLVVDDISTALNELTANGVRVGPVVHKTPRDAWAGRTRDGLDPERTDYATFADFSDPDGNTWRLQEIGHASS